MLRRHRTTIYYYIKVQYRCVLTLGTMTDNGMSKRTRSKRVIRTLASPIDLSVWDPRPRRATKVKSKRDDATQIGQSENGAWAIPADADKQILVNHTRASNGRDQVWDLPHSQCPLIVTTSGLLDSQVRVTKQRLHLLLTVRTDTGRRSHPDARCAGTPSEDAQTR